MKHCLCVVHKRLCHKPIIKVLYYIYLLRLIIFCSTYVNTKNLHEMLDSIVSKSNYLKVHHSNINKRINMTFASYYLYHIRIWHHIWIYIDFTHKHQIEQCDRHIRSECDVQRTRTNIISQILEPFFSKTLFM